MPVVRRDRRRDRASAREASCRRRPSERRADCLLAEQLHDERARVRGRSSKSTQTIFCQTPSSSSPSAIGTVTDGPISAARDVAVAVGVGVALVVLPVVVLGSDPLEHRVQVGVAAGLALDRGDAAGGMGDEHGAEPVGEAGVVDRLLRLRRHVDDLAVALRVERDLLGTYGHGSSLRSRPPSPDALGAAGGRG